MRTGEEGLEWLGWSTTRAEEWSTGVGGRFPAQAVPARVVRSEGVQTIVWDAEGEHRARLSPRMRSGVERPVVGDWVALVRAQPLSRIDGVMERYTCFVRRAAGRKATPQLVAANIDVTFVVTGLDGDFNPRRIERYLAAVQESGSTPVVLLTKAGLVDDVESWTAKARAIAPEVDVHPLDVVTGYGEDVSALYLRAGVTAALVGSSGVGKSTLVNHWLGHEAQKVGDVRQHDRRGQHTTTQREMFRLPSGSLVIDTPGMRELALWADPQVLTAAFSDIDHHAQACRFSDCVHEHEPGCAVQQAVRDGHIKPDRLDSYQRLRRELELAQDRAPGGRPRRMSPIRKGSRGR